MLIEVIEAKSGSSIFIEVKNEGKTLLAILQEQGIYVDAPCGGNGVCGSCQIRVLEPESESGAGDQPGQGENLLLHFACQWVPGQDCRIVLADNATEEIAALAGDGFANSGVHRMRRADRANTQEESKIQAREGDFTEQSVYGIAIDIGTTTLAASLLDLATGAECALAASTNHQRAYGADVISRIQSANEGMGAQLQESIRIDLECLIEELLGQVCADKKQVEKVVIAANTTMCHLLRGLPCEGLGAAPYTPVDLCLWEGTWSELFGSTGKEKKVVSGGRQQSEESCACDVRLENTVRDTAWEAWQAKITILPGISAFVGGDIVAGIYACGMDERKEPGFFLDIGTNGEMAVGNRDGFLVTSAAAGPVFEGGNISCGVPGITGAVTHLVLETRDGVTGADGIGNLGQAVAGNVPDTAPELCTASYETIGNAPPNGLCGTGIIDVVSELVRNRIIDENGTMADTWFDNGVAVAGDSVRFTQDDVRQIQMGKSAIRAGIETLLAEYQKALCAPQNGEDGAVPGNRQRFSPDMYLAGGFGFYMNTESAIRIGLLPGSFAGKISSVGNSSLKGARRYLLSGEKEASARLARIVGHAKEINLAMHTEFNELYLQYMFFEQ